MSRKFGLSLTWRPRKMVFISSLVSWKAKVLEMYQVQRLCSIRKAAWSSLKGQSVCSGGWGRGQCPVYLHSSRPTSRPAPHEHTGPPPAAQVHYSRNQLGCSRPTQELGLGVGSSLASMPPSLSLTSREVGDAVFPESLSNGDHP